MSLDLTTVLNPPGKLTLLVILIISFILGLLHGSTPDEHTWPITFSYSVGSYSTKRGMKAGFAFSAGFTAQRALLTTLGFLGLATIFRVYRVEGPVYVAVGVAMFIAGSRVLKGTYLHLPFDSFLHRIIKDKDKDLISGLGHHTYAAERASPRYLALHAVSMKMALVHGVIAGFGFGTYATIITFVLSPQVPGLIYAPLPGLFFGLGNMVMQIIFGALFAHFAKVKKLSETDLCYLGRYTAGKTLYYGGILFAISGFFITLFPELSDFEITTGISIPNIDAIGLGTGLVLIVVGLIGIWSITKAMETVKKINSGEYCKK